MSMSLRMRWVALALALAAAAGCDAFADPSKSSGDGLPIPPGFGPVAVPAAPGFPGMTPPPNVCPELKPAHGAPCFTTSVCTYPDPGACVMTSALCVDFRWVTEPVPVDPCGPAPEPDLDAGAEGDDDAG